MAIITTHWVHTRSVISTFGKADSTFNSITVSYIKRSLHVFAGLEQSFINTKNELLQHATTGASESSSYTTTSFLAAFQCPENSKRSNITR